jgi:hypothetical protein
MRFSVQLLRTPIAGFLAMIYQKGGISPWEYATGQ